VFFSTIVRRCSEVPFCSLQIVIPGSGRVGQIHLSTDDCPEVDLKSGLSQRGRTRRDCSQSRGRLGRFPYNHADDRFWRHEVFQDAGVAMWWLEREFFTWLAEQKRV